MNPYDPLNVRHPLTVEEREKYERMMELMLADPQTDPWDIARCQECLDGNG